MERQDRAHGRITHLIDLWLAHALNTPATKGKSCPKPSDPLRKFTQLYAFARTEVPATAEAVFFGGNGFRAIGMIAAIEEELGRPVLTGNQLAFCYALRQAGVDAPVNGYGQVFRALSSEGRSSPGPLRPNSCNALGRDIVIDL